MGEAALDAAGAMLDGLAAVLEETPLPHRPEGLAPASPEREPGSDAGRVARAIERAFVAAAVDSLAGALAPKAPNAGEANPDE